MSDAMVTSDANWGVIDVDGNEFDPVAVRLDALDSTMAAAAAARDRAGWHNAWVEAIGLRLTQFLDRWDDAEDEDGWDEGGDWGPAESWPEGPWDHDRWGIAAGEEVA